MLVVIFSFIISLIIILIIIYAGIFYFPSWTWIILTPILLYYIIIYIRNSRIVLRHIIDRYVKDRFEVLTASGNTIVGLEVEVFNKDFIVIRDSEMLHSIKLNKVKNISLITKINGKETMTIEEFIKRFPSK